MRLHISTSNGSELDPSHLAWLIQTILLAAPCGEARLAGGRLFLAGEPGKELTKDRQGQLRHLRIAVYLHCVWPDIPQHLQRTRHCVMREVMQRAELGNDCALRFMFRGGNNVVAKKTHDTMELSQCRQGWLSEEELKMAPEVTDRQYKCNALAHGPAEHI